MKEAELRKHAVCSLCRQKIGVSGLPLFWRVTIERFGVHLDRIRRQDGLTALLGGRAGLASVMGPDEDLAEPLMEKLVLTVCDPCAMRETRIALLVEEGTP